MTFRKETYIYVDATTWETSQGLCDLIGKAIRFWRLNLKDILKALAMPSLGMLMCTLAIQWVFISGKNYSLDEPVKVVAVGTLGMAATLGWIWSLTVVLLRQMAFIRVFAGFAGTYTEALVFTRRRLITMIGVSTIGLMLLVFVGGICMGATWLINTRIPVFAIPATSVVFFLALLFFSIWFPLGLLTVPIVACEQGGTIAVVKRALAIFTSNFRRVMCFGLVLYVVVNVMDTGFAIPVAILQAVDYGLREYGGGQKAEPSYWVLVAVQVWNAVKDLLMRPIVDFAFGMIYLDFLYRNEGLDLQRRLSNFQEQGEQA